MNADKIKIHIKELEIRHRKIDNQIALLETHSADIDDIKYFKKKKLYLRDQISKYNSMIGT